MKLTACLSALDRGIQLIIVLGARDLAAGVFKALEEAQRSARDYVVAASDESVLMQARHVFLRARVGRCVTSKAELSDALASVPVRVKAPADFLVCDSSLLTPQALELARQKGSLMVATGRMPPDRIHDLLQDSSVAGVVKTVEDPMQWVRTTAHAAAAAGCRMRRR